MASCFCDQETLNRTSLYINCIKLPGGDIGPCSTCPSKRHDQPEHNRHALLYLATWNFVVFCGQHSRISGSVKCADFQRLRATVDRLYRLLTSQCDQKSQKVEPSPNYWSNFIILCI